MSSPPPNSEGQDRAHSVAVPADFRGEVERAAAGRQAGDLELLGAEARGFEWEGEGLRLVGRAQFDLKAFEGARATWEAVRQLDESDAEADTLLDTIRRRLGDLPRSDRAGRNAARRTTDAAPARVLLFTGHMIDAPGRERPRFPPDKEGVARQAIREMLLRERESAGAVAHGIAGGASGGDILFHEVCAELEIPTRLFLALPREQYVRASVRPGGPQWVERFERLRRDLPARVLGDSEELPRWLRGKPDYNVWQRNNLWMLYNALAAGGDNVTLVALWDGKAGDGPGGTGDMVRGAAGRGAQTVILDANTLFGT
jgi:hypothetical protein